MTRLAAEHNAINLAQGFPDFDGPEFLKRAARDAIEGGQNQYARMPGLPLLNEAVARWWWDATGRGVDPGAEVTITTGCTQGIPSAILGLVNPGEEVVLFEPFYDSYRACVAMAGATPRYVTLHAPPEGAGRSAAFAFDEGELRRAFNPRTRAVLVNTPHNPTGKVFTREELEVIARLCVEHDVVAITDEVYERLVYDAGAPHVRLATLPGMADRTVTLSSLGKTYSVTGWRIGWAIAPPHLTRAVRAAHQFLTFCVTTPMQHAAAAALTDGEPYVASLVEELRGSRDYLARALEGLGFRVFHAAATYFILADFRRVARGRFADDAEFCRWLVSEVGVAAIPPSAFYAESDEGRSMVRFAFCKRRGTLEKAVERMQSVRG